jgi:hypothetical protein
MYRMMTSERGEKEETLFIVVGAAAAAIFFLLAVNTSGAVNDMEVVRGHDAPIIQYSSFSFHYADAITATTSTSTTVDEKNSNNNNDVTFHLQGNHTENTVEEVLAAVGYDMTDFERFSNGTIVVTATKVFDYNNNDNNNIPTTNNWWQEMRVNQKE